MIVEGINTTGKTYQGSSQTTGKVNQGNSQEPAVNAAGASAGSESAAKTLKQVSNPKQHTLNIDDGNDAAENKMQSPTEALKKAVEEINKRAINSEAIFGIHEDTNRVTIKIVDRDSREVLMEYPPEKTLDMIAKVWELAGLLIDEKR